MDIVGPLGAQGRELGLAADDRPALEQVPAEHLAGDSWLATAKLDSSALQPHRQRVVVVVRGRLGELVVAVAEHLGREIVARRQIIERQSSLLEAGSLDVGPQKLLDE